MKTRTLVSIMILVLAVLIIAGSCATDRTLKKTDQNEIVGAWINTEYNDISGKFGKQIIQSDLSVIIYKKDFDQKDIGMALITIEERWIDSEEIIWYKAIYSMGVNRYHKLYKLSNSGRTLEETHKGNDYPVEIDPNHWSYRIYYRQE